MSGARFRNAGCVALHWQYREESQPVHFDRASAGHAAVM